MDITMARSPGIEFIKDYCIPSFSIKVSGFELGLNYYIREHSELGGYERTWFVLQIADVDICRIKKAPLASEYTFFGYKRTYDEGDYIPSFDFKAINLLIAIGLFLTAGLAMGSIMPQVFITLVPVLFEPIAGMSIYSILLSYRVFVVLLQVQIFLANFIHQILNGRTNDRDTIAPLFHYRIWAFLLILPAVCLDYSPFMFVMASTAVISILDVIAVKQSIFMFSWLLLHLNVMGFDFRSSSLSNATSEKELEVGSDDHDVERQRFRPIIIDTVMFTADPRGVVYSCFSDINKAMNPSFVSSAE
jgi:hypothetical protein